MARLQGLGKMNTSCALSSKDDIAGIEIIQRHANHIERITLTELELQAVTHFCGQAENVSGEICLSGVAQVDLIEAVFEINNAVIATVIKGG